MLCIENRILSHLSPWLHKSRLTHIAVSALQMDDLSLLSLRVYRPQNKVNQNYTNVH